MKSHIKFSMLLLASLFSFNVAAGSYSNNHAVKQYIVTITNLTKGMLFTPFLVATHNRNISLFELGELASDEISRVAEGGDISGLDLLLNNSNDVYATSSSGGLLSPGESVEIMIESNIYNRKVSLVAMLLPTNDTMVALNGGALPNYGRVTYLLNAYDGGSETNDELCIHIPGPQCGGEPFSPDDAGEGYVYPSPSIHGQGNVSNADYQWDGVVAKVIIQAMN